MRIEGKRVTWVVVYSFIGLGIIIGAAAVSAGIDIWAVVIAVGIGGYVVEVLHRIHHGDSCYPTLRGGSGAGQEATSDE